MSFVEATPSVMAAHADCYQRALGICVSNKLPGDPSALHALSNEPRLNDKSGGVIHTEDVLLLKQWITPYFSKAS